MQKKLLKLVLILLGCVAIGTPALAVEPKLMVGDPAPALQPGKWIQGEPVQSFEKGKAYLVEFFTLWRPSSTMAIPALTQLHERYKDKGLVVIGQDCWEQEESGVETFVKKMGGKLPYRVALDNKQGGGDGLMAETWMMAAGQHGIPTAFLVDTQGRIAWIGDPQALKPELIEEVLSGKFDTVKAAADYKEGFAQVERQREEIRSKEERVKAAATGLDKAMRDGNWDAAMSNVNTLDQLLVATSRQRQGLDLVRFEIFLGQSNYPAAYKLASAIHSSEKTNLFVQNQLAWEIATIGNPEKRDLAQAEACALRAQELSASLDANTRSGVLDTLARVRFLQGRKDESVELEKQALELAAPIRKVDVRKALESYQKGELPSVN